MSYTLFGQQGPIMQLASVGGMNDLIEFVERMTIRGAFKEFLDTGETVNVPEVIREITAFIPYATSSSVQATLINLKQGLEQAGNMAGISE